MSEYQCHHTTKMTTPSVDVQEKKQARKRLLKQIEQRRRENYKRFIKKKRQLQPDSDFI
jgi:hypothetical protein